MCNNAQRAIKLLCFKTTGRESCVFFLALLLLLLKGIGVEGSGLNKFGFSTLYTPT